MDDMTVSTPADLPLRRRNSTSTPVVVPTKLSLLPSETHHHHNYNFPSSTTTSTITSATSPSSSTYSHQSFPNVDFDLLSIRHISYTSLKDLLPSTAVQSPTTQSQSEISIRNRLVNRAAWAYLRPMATSPDSAATNCLSALFSFVDRHIIRTITRVFDWLQRPFWIWSSR